MQPGQGENVPGCNFFEEIIKKSIDNCYNLDYTVQAIAFETNVKADMGS